MELILIRHAQSKGNKTNTVQGNTDEGLSDVGIEQAIELTNYFKAGDISLIYSSNLKRAIETASPLSKKLYLEINIEPDLQEAHFGIWETMTYEEVQKNYPVEYSAWHQNYFVRPSWFESFDSHLKRTKKVIEKILNNNSKSSKIGVFTHGGTIKTQLGYFNKLSGEELAGLRTENCSLTIIEFNPSTRYEDGKLICYNKVVINKSSKRS